MKPRVRVSEVKLGPLTRVASIKPGTIDPEARTVDLIFSTGAPVQRYDWWNGQRYVETLSLEPSAIRLGRLNNGAPFLNSHSSYSLGSVLGVVVDGSAKIQDGEGVARVRFSTRADVEPIWKDIQDGIIRNVSVGYEVHKYEKTEIEGKPTQLRAVDWEPYEISAVPMGADDGAKIRAAMKADEVRAIPAFSTRASAPTKELPAMEPKIAVKVRQVEPDADGNCGDGYEMGEDGMCHLVEAAAEPESERALGARLETARVEGILRAAGAVNLSPSCELVMGMIRSGRPLVECQADILEWHRTHSGDHLGPRRGPSRVSTVTADALDKAAPAITSALLNRIDPKKWPLDDGAKAFRGRSLLGIAEYCLKQRGVDTSALGKHELAKLAFQPMNFQARAGLHTTSDFANILADVANKSLRRAYDESPATWVPISRRITITDFKSVKRNQLGEAPALQKVLEHGEFTRGTIAEGKEEFALATYGRIFGITRQALINDDLDAFGRLVTMFGRAARNLESDVVWFQIMYGKTLLMADGNAIFSTAHANFTDSGGAIDIDELSIGRALMRNQKGLDGVTFLNIAPRFLIVGPANETVAQQYTTVAQGAAVLTPDQAANNNPFAGTLAVITEPRLEGSVTVDGVTATGDTAQWYLSADPSQIDIIEYGYLDGDEGPVVESRVGFDVDGMETKCRLDFAAKVIDYRGLYRNDGQ